MEERNELFLPLRNEKKKKHKNKYFKDISSKYTHMRKKTPKSFYRFFAKYVHV